MIHLPFSIKYFVVLLFLLASQGYAMEQFEEIYNLNKFDSSFLRYKKNKKMLPLNDFLASGQAEEVFEIKFKNLPDNIYIEEVEDSQIAFEAFDDKLFPDIEYSFNDNKLSIYFKRFNKYKRKYLVDGKVSNNIPKPSYNKEELLLLGNAFHYIISDIKFAYDLNKHFIIM